MTEQEKDEFILLTADGCSHCKNAKELLQDKITSGQIKTMDIILDDEAAELAGKYDVKAVPIMLFKDGKTGLFEACELANDGSKLLCKDKEVKL